MNNLIAQQLEELEDELVEGAREKNWINDWEYKFVMNLVNYMTLSEKQERKLGLIKKKIARGLQREMLAADGDPLSPIFEPPQKLCCPHCGKGFPVH